ncbi:MAG: GNAT family N-acetyltransferase [Alphaproteobacteria bacterium]|nr:GNAT family N-acetyltransferase [Alphaproteobacteria bacterium]
MLATPGVRGWGMRDAFLLFRATGDEGEILTLAVDQASRRHGRARALLSRCIVDARADGVRMLFLEVAWENAAARALYGQAGFLEVARRPNYYRGTGEGTDGLVLRLDLPPSPEGVETRGGMV